MKRLAALLLLTLAQGLPALAQGAGSQFNGGFTSNGGFAGGSFGIQNRNFLQPFRAFYPRLYSNPNNPWLPSAPTPTYPVSPSNPSPGAYYPSNPANAFNPYNPPSPLPPYNQLYPLVPSTVPTTGAAASNSGLTASFANQPANQNIGQFNPAAQSTPLNP
jgi:hypothetical protein